MAGIGFRLQNLLRDESYTGLAKAYLYAAYVSCGPWVLAIFALFWIGIVGTSTRYDLALFRTVVTYTFCGSLLLTGLIQMGTTRYISDRLFVRDMEALAPCYRWVVLVVALASGLAGVLFHAFAGLSLAQAVAGVVLFQAVSLIWVGMTFLSAAKDYQALVRAFLLGYALTVGAAVAGAQWWGMTGLLWGIALGQLILAGILGGRVLVEFPSERPMETAVWSTWKRMPALAAVGFLFNLGVWDDKIVFWASSGAQTLQGLFRVESRYDICSFIGYLSIVPALSLFLIRVETAFYKHYAAFFDAAVRGRDLPALRQQKQRMLDALRLSAGRLLSIQGLISLAFIMMAPQILSWMQLPQDYTSTLRLMLLSSLALVMLLILLVILLYFDWQWETALLAGLFAASNAAFAWVSQRYFEDYYHGFGALLSCLVTIILGTAILNFRIKDLEYETFTKQPILH